MPPAVRAIAGRTSGARPCTRPRAESSSPRGRRGHASQGVSSTAALAVTALLAAGLGAVGGSVGAERPRARESAYLQSIDDERRLLAALSRRASSSPAARS